jgi:Fis family transcriptional regulator, factor for inversion stimulation protein
MGQKHSYPTSAQLDAVVLEMYRAGIPYADAVREFKRQFILTALRDSNWNESKAAPVLRMHRNTLRRVVREFNLDIRALRKSKRRSPRGIAEEQQKKSAG